MRKRNRNLLRLYATAILISLILLSASCRTKTELVPIGDAVIVRQLPNGNYEVTPAFIQKTFKALERNKQLKKELDDCRGVE